MNMVKIGGEKPSEKNVQVLTAVPKHSRGWAHVQMGDVFGYLLLAAWRCSFERAGFVVWVLPIRMKGVSPSAEWNPVPLRVTEPQLARLSSEGLNQK